MDFETFLSLCDEFIKSQRQIEKNDILTETDDLSVLYRFICIHGWKELNERSK